MLEKILESVGRIDEIAKPKGTVDKKFNVAPKESKSAFKVGQTVALYRGMGTTDHGKIHALDIKSGGNTGAMVHFVGGEKEFHPYSKLKDAKQYWSDEQDKMYKERSESVEIEELSIPTLKSYREKAKASKESELDKMNSFSAAGKLHNHIGLNAPKKEKQAHFATAKDNYAKGAHHSNVAQNRMKGIATATRKIAEEYEEIEEGTSGTVIHKVNHEGKVKFITRYAKAAEAVAAKIKANTGKDCHITQHISDKNGFYRLHKESVEIEESADGRWELYAADKSKGYTCHHIPKSQAKDGEQRFKHTLNGKTILSHSKYYPEEFKSKMNESSDDEEWDDEKDRKERLAQAMKATGELAKRKAPKVGHSGWERYPDAVAAREKERSALLAKTMK